ncbi:CaiB/BaiF CoA transferase family protein [Halocynthiibacter namhaensis]|uniref:CaiB/BaiF CoA transferase family protein n=1 Tax=Halocynthiibacter namhaensis TaxID=1290553 RepID=UPI00057970E9|nr:CaiB/BaiF CoA-transferase family protein [Halocynthiibacter namhaensis]
MTENQSHGPLHGLKVLDLSRILAGPTCTQLLGDMGADVIKIENPATGGDDTRAWGPPYVEMADGSDSDISAYFICANRNKRSVAVDIATSEGQKIIRDLAGTADVLIENFKPGSLAKYGLDYASFKDELPGLVYCSISGYGQTGPNASKPGYDLMAQGYGGIMSLTGEPEGDPMKVGVGIADVMCGMYATTGILAALRHRDATGEGQQIDIALVDSQIAWLINEGVNYRVSGELPKRRGNGHPNIVPYKTCAASDGHVILAVGNDTQFQRFMTWLGLGEQADDPRFATNPARLENRDALYALIDPEMAKHPMAEIISGLEAIKVPVGPVNTLYQVMTSDQVAARNMAPGLASEDAADGVIPVLGNPLNFSATPVTYRRAPPRFGADTDAILAELAADQSKD